MIILDIRHTNGLERMAYVSGVNKSWERRKGNAKTIKTVTWLRQERSHADFIRRNGAISKLNRFTGKDQAKAWM